MTTTILVADDDEPGRRYVASVLRSMGHRVVEADDGQRALELAEQDPPDLLFTDLLMPRLDGYELAHRLRGGPLADLPMIFYTATYQELEGRALAASLSAVVLVKPAEPAEIIRLVNAQLRRPAPSRRRGRGAERFVQEHRRLVVDKLASKIDELSLVRERLNALLGLAVGAGVPSDVRDLLRLVCGRAREIVPSRFAGIVIADADTDAPELFVTSGLTDVEAAGMALDGPLDGILAQVMRAGVAVRAGPRPSARLRHLPRGHPAVSSFIVVPLPIMPWRGVLYLADRLAAKAYDDQDEKAVLAIAGLLAGPYRTHRLIAGLQTTIERLEATEGNLELSEQRFRTAIEMASDPIIAMDTSGLVTFANGQAGQAFGYPGGALVGLPIERLIPEPVAGHGLRAALVSDARARRGQRSLELAGRRHDGTEFPIEVELTRVDMPDGVSVFARVVDITARRELAAKVRQAEKLESIGQLAGGIAHDFNNLLTVINWYGELLASDLAPDDPRREYVDGIAHAADRAGRLTRQLLAFGRRQRLAPAWIDVNAQIREIEPMLRGVMGEVSTVVLDLAEELPPALFEASQLGQILVNLAMNARDALPTGGRFEIRTGIAPGQDDPSVPVDLGPGAHLLLGVMDTGEGMDAATRARIFEPFFTTKGPGKGTGLGLSSVYGIVKQLNGAISVDSEPGRGTTFRIYIPVGDRRGGGPRDAVHRRAVVRPEPHRSSTVLVVEDDRQVLELVERLLRDRGYEVLAFDRPEAALAALEMPHQPISLLIADVVMPGMTGHALAAAVRRREDVPVLFMSGYAEGEGQLVPPSSEEAFLAKPFSASALASRVAALVRPAKRTRARRPAVTRRAST